MSVNDLDYVLDSGLWSFVGLLLGYVLGKIESRLQQEYERPWLREERHDYS